MHDNAWCKTCGSELQWMSPHLKGCLSCYADSGPGWQIRWLNDCAAASRKTKIYNVIPFARQPASGASPSLH